MGTREWGGRNRKVRAFDGTSPVSLSTFGVTNYRNGSEINYIQRSTYPWASQWKDSARLHTFQYLFISRCYALRKHDFSYLAFGLSCCALARDTHLAQTLCAERFSVCCPRSGESRGRRRNVCVCRVHARCESLDRDSQWKTHLNLHRSHQKDGLCKQINIGNQIVFEILWNKKERSRARKRERNRKWVKRRGDGRARDARLKRDCESQRLSSIEHFVAELRCEHSYVVSEMIRHSRIS